MGSVKAGRKAPGGRRAVPAQVALFPGVGAALQSGPGGTWGTWGVEGPLQGRLSGGASLAGMTFPAVSSGLGIGRRKGVVGVSPSDAMRGQKCSYFLYF